MSISGMDEKGVEPSLEDEDLLLEDEDPPLDDEGMSDVPTKSSTSPA